MLRRAKRRRLRDMICVAALTFALTGPAQAQTVAEEIIDRLLGGSTFDRSGIA